MQCHLDREGASDLVVELIMKNPSHKIFVESVELGIALLEGGNSVIQQSVLQKLISGNSSEKFFKVCWSLRSLTLPRRSIGKPSSTDLIIVANDPISPDQVFNEKFAKAQQEIKNTVMVSTVDVHKTSSSAISGKDNKGHTLPGFFSLTMDIAASHECS